ncbi:adenine/guanine permease AZG1 [Chloropicon primus]|uniref:Adenine/guanine permease AZG1 n=2 Tax=Chloropicon primus TaxID=1764295 RepID=A0A5B8MWI2_9CHLO|nr:adenine/guanine permease AZG1 [Chloropicon primus]UPR03023.1 adenine/guanine permease AZG1 [Chloropicon primus]|eukprot:QDZ23810.1 adenine/guanine permease AZG1 [Chloropicon primus]
MTEESNNNPASAEEEMEKEEEETSLFRKIVDKTGVLGDFSHLNAKDPFLMKEKGSNWWTELRAGTVTFLTMAYILPVNANILGIVIPYKKDLIIATAAAGCIGSILMGLLSNFPFGLAPGMGANAYFTFTAVLSYGMPWQDALTAVFFSGIFFLVLSLLGLRTLLVRLLPRGVQLAVGAGIGIFLCFIGLQSVEGMALVVDNPATLVQLNTPLTVSSNYDASKMWLSVVVLVLTATMMTIKIPGAPLVGIVFGTLVAWSECWARQNASAFNYPVGACGGGLNATQYEDAGCFCYAPDKFAEAAKIENTAGVFQWAAVGDNGFWVAVFTFLYTDILDSSGTFFAVAKRAGCVDKNGNLPKGQANMAYAADSIGTIVGSCMGTSTVTTYIESAAGVVDGGRTGLTAIAVGLWFALAIPFAPVLSEIPPLASGPILCIVGALMMKNISDFDWSDAEEALPAFATLVMIPLTFNIAYGIIAGTMMWIIMQVLLMPWRMLVLKKDPLIKFKLLLLDEVTLDAFNEASLEHGADAETNFLGHMTGKSKEEIQLAHQQEKEQ